MEARPAYAALRGDFYTHAMDLPPQLSPFGLSQSAEARRNFTRQATNKYPRYQQAPQNPSYP